MKEAERTILGYLAAFTLGVICMGVIALVLMRARHTVPPPEPEILAPPQEEVGTRPASELRRQTFQRMPRSIAPPVIEPVVTEEPQQPPAPAPTEKGEDQSPRIVVVPVTRPAPVHSTVASTATLRGGRLSGRVTFSGTPPPERELPLAADPICSQFVKKGLAPATTRFYVQGKDGGLADVVVSLAGVSPKGRSYEKSLLVEQACNIEPYISAGLVGQKISLQNRDRVLHNPRLESKNNGELHRTLLPGALNSFAFELKAPEEFIRIRCDVHPWEFAYISVFDHPYFAVTDKNGVFVIDGIPSGRYTVQAHHRKAGVVTKEIEIEAYRNAELQFVIEIPPTQTAAVQ